MDKIQLKFEAYHKNNPHVYDLFVQYAREVKKTGLNKYSIWAVANRVRWHNQFEVKTTDAFKISNNYLAYYSRFIMATEPDLTGFFTTKKTNAAGAGQ